MNIPLSPQKASLLYSGTNGQQGQQASPSDSYMLGFPKAIESEIDLVDVLYYLSKLLSLHQSDVSRSGLDMIERKEIRSKTFRLSPFNCHILFSQMHRLALHKWTKRDSRNQKWHCRGIASFYIVNR